MHQYFTITASLRVHAAVLRFDFERGSADALRLLKFVAIVEQSTEVQECRVVLRRELYCFAIAYELLESLVQ